MRLAGTFLAFSLLVSSVGLAEAGRGQTSSSRSATPAARASARAPAKAKAKTKAKSRSLAASRKAREEFPWGTALGSFERITFSSITHLLDGAEAGTLESTMDNPSPIQMRPVELRPLVREYQQRVRGRDGESATAFLARRDALEKELFGPLGLSSRDAQDIAWGSGDGVFFQEVKGPAQVANPHHAIAQRILAQASASSGYGRMLGRVRKDPVAMVKFMQRVYEGRFLRRGAAPTADEARLYDDLLAALKPVEGFIDSDVAHEIKVSGEVERADAETALLPKERVRKATAGLFERR